MSTYYHLRRMKSRKWYQRRNKKYFRLMKALKAWAREATTAREQPPDPPSGDARRVPAPRKEIVKPPPRTSRQQLLDDVQDILESHIGRQIGATGLWEIENEVQTYILELGEPDLRENIRLFELVLIPNPHGPAGVTWRYRERLHDVLDRLDGP